MNRRTYIRVTGLAAIAATSSLAGCESDETSTDGGGSPSSTPEGTLTSEGTPTPEPTPTQSPTPTPEPTPEPGSLEVQEVDDVDVDERRTLLLQVSVENTGEVTRSGVVVGEAEVDDQTHTARRQVSLGAGETTTVPVKVTYSSASAIITYTTDASIEDDRRGTPTEPVDNGPQNDVVIRELDSSSTDEEQTVELEAVMDNLSQDDRTVVLAGQIDIEGGDFFRNRQEVTVFGGDERTGTIDVEYESEDGFVSYTYTAWVEKP